MYGNVSEWVLDGYAPGSDAGDMKKECSVEESFRKPTTVFPRTLRGGSFVSEADLCDSTARLGSDDEPWKEEDPNYPQSPWWYTGYEGLGAGMIGTPTWIPSARSPTAESIPMAGEQSAKSMKTWTKIWRS